MTHNNGHKTNGYEASLKENEMKDGYERGNLWSIVLASGDICTMPFGVFQ